MNSRLSLRRRPWVEELEPRVVLSAPVPTISTTSTNWSGYAVQTNFNSPASNSVTAVSGSWVVPSVTGSGTAYSSFWVGIDGYSSGSVEQIGTDSDIINGTPVYYAWYEMYPNPSRSVALTINAGDTINASVVYSPSTKVYTLSLTDVTSGKSFSIGQKLAGAQNSSAEWIAEAPSSRFGVLPLANFGTANFFNASATINGTSGPIDSPSWQSALINMVTNTGAAKATTSALNPDTTTNGATTSSFSVAFNSSGVVPRLPHFGRHGFHAANDAVTPVADTNVAASSVNPGQANAALSTVNVIVTAPSTTPVGVVAQSATPLSPALLPLTLNGIRAGTVIDDGMDDDAAQAAIWLPASATPVRPAQTQSITETLIPYRQPAIMTEAVPMSGALQGNDAAPEMKDAVQIPASEAGAVAEGNIVTRTFSKALWLLAAVGFVTHVAFVSKVREREDGDPRAKKKAD